MRRGRRSGQDDPKPGRRDTAIAELGPIEMIKEATLNDRDVLAKLIRDSFHDVARRFSLTKDNCPKHPSNCTSSWIESDISRGVQYYLLCADEAPIGCVAIETQTKNFPHLPFTVCLMEFEI